jgi:diaminopropionate ammonia-lyase
MHPAPMPRTGLVELLLNRGLDRSRPYAEAERQILSMAAAQAAMETISAWPGYAPTPLVPLDGVARAAGVASVAIKHEGHRFGLGSFKALGGAYAVERVVAARGGTAGLTVTSATDGNHGRSVAWGARRHGITCIIYIHTHVSAGRADAIAAFGAEVRRVPGTYDDAVRAAAKAAADEGAVVISDTSWPGYEDMPRDVMQGYAVLAMEAQAQGARPTHVFVQGGVGGLAAALLAVEWEQHGAARPRLVVVEPERAACLMESARAGRPAVVGGDLATIMTGLSCGEASLLAWRLLGPGADAFMRIADEAAAQTMRLLAGQGLAVGESGVAGLAGFLLAANDPAARERLRLDAASRVLCYATEGATDAAVYREIVGQDAVDVEPAAADRL